MKSIEGPFIAPTSGKADSMVMFLHGYGANGADLLSIGEEWADELPNTVFIAPNAPDVCEQWAAGYQWFSIRALENRDMHEREKQVAEAAPALSAYIDGQLKTWGVAENKLVVAGFSQGAMMAMYTMPRRSSPCAGVIGYSGMLIGAGGLLADKISKVPVLAIHGDQDSIVPPQCLADVQSGFDAAGFDAETIMRSGLAHGIDHFGLMRGLEFAKEQIEK